jgi:hypothetical protein
MNQVVIPNAREPGRRASLDPTLPLHCTLSEREVKSC